MKFDFVVFHAGASNHDRLREAWTCVVRQLDEPAYYHYFEWYEAYVKTLEPDPTSVIFVVAYRNRQPVGVFPLRFARRRIAGIPLRALEIPHSPVTLLGDFVFRICPANASIVWQLLQFMRRQKGLRFDVAQISNALEGSAALFSLRSDAPPRIIEDEEPGCHYTDCREFTVSPKLRNKRNRLARVGNIEFAHIRDAESMNGAVDEFMDVEASGWKRGEGTAIRCRPNEVAFYHEIAARFSAANAAQVSLLRVGGRCIAGFFMLRTGRTLYWLKHGYDEEFAKSSPGQLLFTDMVSDCLARGDVDQINFITNNEWHRIFSPREAAKRSTLIFRGNLPGLAAYIGLRCKSTIRWVARRSFTGRIKLGVRQHQTT